MTLWQKIQLGRQALSLMDELGKGDNPMGKVLDTVVPFFVGHRTEITVFVTAALNLLVALVPSVAPYAATTVAKVTAAAPFLAALFAAARANRPA